MGCLFPKSQGLKQYWHLLMQGIDGTSDVPESHWSVADYFDNDPKRPDHVYCKRGGFLSSVPFDPVEFGIPPPSLEATDTSQLLGLVCAKMAIEDAGYGNGQDFNRDRTGVILGVTGTQELVIPLSARLGHPIWRRALTESGISPEKSDDIIQKISNEYVPWQENSFPGLLGNVVAGRISNRLNLGGTNCVADAACASSLSAIHLALMELQSGNCDMILTGGVDTLNDIFMHMCFAKSHVLSPTGDARPFSKHADGTVLGEGIGMLVLKRLEDAERDGNKIYAVIKSIGSSSDGKSQSIYAPRADGQQRALQMAYEKAGIEPTTVELIEAHGTGTRVGDQVEFQALCGVFGQNGNGSKNRCAVGSVKSMIGHTKAAAGAAGMVKAALSLYHKALTPTLKADEPDPALNITDSPFYINTQTRPWFSKTNHPRRAGVSAFGFGGSNFHVVLEEYHKTKQDVAWDGSVEILALSADSQTGLKRRLDAIQRQFQNHENISYAAAASRCEFSSTDEHRLLLVIDQTLAPADASSLKELLDHAAQAMSEKKIHRTHPHPHPHPNIYFGHSQKPGKLAFMFPGQGSQYVGMGGDLICLFPEAFSILETINEAFDPDDPLSDIIYPPSTISKDHQKNLQEKLRQTEFAQPAIGALNLAFMKILFRFGIRPDVTCGHSFGELTALCAAGWIDIESTLRLSKLRGEYMASAGRQHQGAMLAIQVSPDQLTDLFNSVNTEIFLANRNSPTQVVVSGSPKGIECAEDWCRKKGFRFKQLPVSGAFHTAHMKSALSEFQKAVDTVNFTPTNIPVQSCMTGQPYPMDSQKAKRLISEQLVNPIDFVGNLENLYANGTRAYLEVGPGSVLKGLAQSTLSKTPARPMAMDPSLGKRFGLVDLAHTLCQLTALGYRVELNQWEQPTLDSPEPKMRIPLLGANYRNRKSDTTTHSPSVLKSNNHPLEKALSQEIDTLENASQKIEQTDQKDTTYMEKESPAASNAIAEALKMATEGLKSLQKLQVQTAETHKKFLETQAEASRTLKEMMINAQRLTHSGLSLPPIQPEATTVVDQASEALEAITDRVELNPKVMPTHPSDERKPEDNSSDNSEIERTLLSVVSQLTGYPAEMLNMEMDIEADLGIDSIKRVEILSSLEETLPGLPKVSPEIMGTLKTLGQIVTYLRDSESIESSERKPSNAVKETLISVVSRLTGYPAEMLDMEMDIEADLGIDSIKRVEILSTLEETVPNLPTISPEVLGSLRTLGQIVDYLEKAPTNASIETSEKTESTDTVSSKRPDNEAIKPAQRHLITLQNTPYITGNSIALPKGSKIYLTEDSHGLSKAISARFARYGIEAITVSPEQIIQNGQYSDAAGLIILSEIDVKTAFSLAQTLGPALNVSAEKGGAIFATISRMDGVFGFRNIGSADPMQGGLAGLIKTAVIEWPNVCCRAFDLEPAWEDTSAIAETVVSELLNPMDSEQIEIGLGADARVTLNLESADYPEGTVQLVPKDVVVISGGARGVTANVAYALAKTIKPTLLLLGRSPMPFPEPEHIVSLTDEAAIKKAILEKEFLHERPSPRIIEKAYMRYMGNREILTNLHKLEKTGATVYYRCVDIRNDQHVHEALDEIRSLHGPIKAVIHAAGVINDRYILDKTQEQFDNVLDTKVKGLQAFLGATRKDPLKYIIIFSSITARVGNIGQVDYAMANEVLNKMAQQEAATKSDCRVLSINWGPWDGGMVSESLKKEFSNQGIPLISLNSGAASMLEEMKGWPTGPVEIVIGSRQFEQPPLSLSFKRDIDIEQYPVLESHVLGGKPVVPLALIAEWLSHGALHENPGFLVHGFDDLRLLKGIKVNKEKRTIRLLAGKPRKNGDVFEVDVELRDGFKDGKEVIHSTAKAILTNDLSQGPIYTVLDNIEPNSYSRSIDEIYDKILFHGSKLRGIKHIINVSSAGIIAKISTAPPPSKWFKEPMRSRWILDPLALDAAFQMATLWCYEEKGRVSLPSYCASYRQYRQKLPSDGVTAVLEVETVCDRKMTGHFTFLDSDNTVIATLKGYEAIMDAGLMSAFKPTRT